MLTPWKKSHDKIRKHIKKQRHYFANKDPASQSYCFSSGHVRMWELDCKESWALKNWCLWTVVLEKTLESTLDWKEIKPSVLKEIWNSRSLATWCEELTPWNRPWCWERLKAGGKRDDRGWDGWMASPTGWRWVWVSSESDRQGSVASCSPWGCKESEMTERLNQTERNILRYWSAK